MLHPQFAAIKHKDRLVNADHAWRDDDDAWRDEPSPHNEEASPPWVAGLDLLWGDQVNVQIIYHS